MSTRTGIRISALQEDLDELTRVDISSDSTTATISTEGTKDLILNTNEGTNSGAVTIYDGASGDIELSPKGDVVVDDGDIQLNPTTTSTAHIKVPAGSLDIRCANDLKMGTDGADSVRIGRDNTTATKVYIRSGADSDLVVSDSKVGVGTDSPAHTLDVAGDVDISGGLSFDSGTAVTSIDTDLSSVSGSDDTLASAKAIKTYVDSVSGGGGALEFDIGTSATTIPAEYSNDGDTSGEMLHFLNVTTTKGDIYYLSSDPSFHLAQADDESDGAAGDILAVAVGTDSNSDGMMLNGMVRIDSGGYVGTAAVGKRGYLSETTAGAVDFDAPDASGNVVRAIGSCIQVDGSNNILFYFSPSAEYQVIA